MSGLVKGSLSADKVASLSRFIDGDHRKCASDGPNGSPRVRSVSPIF